jgi:hypothetical protein
MVWFSKNGNVVKCPDQLAALGKLSKQASVIDLEPKNLGGGMEVRAVNEKRGPAGAGGNGTHRPVLI